MSRRRLAAYARRQGDESACDDAWQLAVFYLWDRVRRGVVRGEDVHEGWLLRGARDQLLNMGVARRSERNPCRLAVVLSCFDTDRGRSWEPAAGGEDGRGAVAVEIVGDALAHADEGERVALVAVMSAAVEGDMDSATAIYGVVQRRVGVAIGQAVVLVKRVRRLLREAAELRGVYISEGAKRGRGRIGGQFSNA